MEDAEFKRRVIEAMNEPTTMIEERRYGCQCSADLGQIYADRIWQIMQEAGIDVQTTFLDVGPSPDHSLGDVEGLPDRPIF